MGLNLNYGTGQTPIDEDEKEGLIPVWVIDTEDLNQAENDNVMKALSWIMKQRLTSNQIICVSFVKQLHKKMFEDVWHWAGTFRRSNKNIGIDKCDISGSIASLLGDVAYWVANQTYPPDEIAIRLKHRMVSIHPFPNGNGRHSRLLADVFMSKIYGENAFSWGASLEGARRRYIASLKQADQGDYEGLILFARK